MFLGNESRRSEPLVARFEKQRLSSFGMLPKILRNRRTCKAGDAHGACDSDTLNPESLWESIPRRFSFPTPHGTGNRISLLIPHSSHCSAFLGRWTTGNEVKC